MIKGYLKAASFYTFAFLLLLQAITDTDFGWHHAVGKYIFENFQIPKHDLFSFTLPSFPYVYHSWASYLTVFLGYKIAGFAGVSIIYSLVLTLSVFFLIKITKVLYPKKLNYILFLTMTPFLQSIAGARPRAFSFLFFTIVYYLFVKYAKFKSKTIYFVPFIFILWVNFHGSFLVGFLTFLLLILISLFLKKIDPYQIKTLIKISILSFLATIINPYHLNAWKQALEIGFNSSLNLKAINIDWKPLITSGNNGWIFALFIILTVMIAASLKLKIQLQEKVLLTIFFIFSLYTARFALPLLVFYIPFTHLVISEFISRINNNILRLPPIKIAIISLSLVFVLVAITNIVQLTTVYNNFDSYSNFLQTRSPNKFAYASWHYRSSQYIVDHFADKNILIDANWSGYLLLLNPKVKVFYYGAMDNYFYNNTSFAYEYLKLINGNNKTEEMLENFKVDIVYLPPTYPIVKNLKLNPNWKIILENNKAIVFSKI